jgi:hypothetical protein
MLPSTESIWEAVDTGDSDILQVMTGEKSLEKIFWKVRIGFVGK